MRASFPAVPARLAESPWKWDLLAVSNPAFPVQLPIRTAGDDRHDPCPAVTLFF